MVALDADLTCCHRTPPWIAYIPPTRVSLSNHVYHVMTEINYAWEAKQGKARQSRARQGKAGQGRAAGGGKQCKQGRHGRQGHGRDSAVACRDKSSKHGAYPRSRFEHDESAIFVDVEQN